MKASYRDPMFKLSAMAACLGLIVACHPALFPLPELCPPSPGAPRPALAGLKHVPAGKVGARSNFSPALLLPAETSVTSVHLPDGPVVYEAATVFGTTQFQATDVAQLRAVFRALVSQAREPASPWTNREAVGYEHAPFTVDDPAPSVLAGPNASSFPAYTQWRIQYGWSGSAIREARDATGTVSYRFEPTALYANLSSATRLPDWKPRTESDRAAWHRFSCAVRQHEALHVDNGRAVTERVLHQLVKLSAPSAEALEAEYHSVWAAGLRWGQREDVRLDVYTGHGALL